MYERILEESGFSGARQKRRELAQALLAEDLGSWNHISAEVTGWGLSLQKSGYALGILSNMPHDFLDRFGKSIVLFNRADVAVFSCRVGQIKPESEIYDTLITELGCAPGETVFFDDIQANIDGARRAGIQAFRWTDLDQARKDWATITGN
jgi:putative hydrolase of the HAD superfamily